MAVAFPPRYGRVVIVASLGGLDVVTRIVAALPASYPIPVVVVQHRGRTSDGRDPLSTILAYKSQLPVQLAGAGGRSDQVGITVVPAQSTATIDGVGRWRIADARWDAGPRGNQRPHR